MNDYCTLFDKNYLLFALALHRSLLRTGTRFRLFMLAMDRTAENALRALRLEHVVIVALEDVVTEAYAFVHRQMTFGQICWTCQPLLCRHVLERYRADAVTYLEADSYFFADPAVLFDEIGDGSVSLVPHNYAPGCDQTASSGVYCVQFNLFRNDAAARELLLEWERACLRYDRRRPRYFPGQTCLDGWPARSSAVRVVANPGAGVAPWNAQRFAFASSPAGPTIDGRPIVFYHFHEVAFMDDGGFFLSSYRLGRDVVDCVYRPYVAELDALRRQVRAAVPGFEHGKAFRSPGAWRSFASLSRLQMRGYLKFVYSYWRGRRNIIRPDAAATPAAPRTA